MRAAEPVRRPEPRKRPKGVRPLRGVRTKGAGPICRSRRGRLQTRTGDGGGSNPLSALLRDPCL